jgi:hypothetical protein
MANNVLLNSIDHQNIKVITEHSAAYGDNVWYAPTFPSEFRSVQAYYPIFFNKDPNTGKFFSIALFGFQDQENLFLQDKKWQAAYIPLTVARLPFLIGVQKNHELGEEKQQRMLHIDLDNPRVNQQQGEALFMPHGGNTPFLDRAADMLEVIHHGLVDNAAFIEQLVNLQLLESFILDITLNDNSQYQMLGFYTINEEKLAELNDETLGQLHQQGYLQAIYMTIASQANVRTLMNKKNAQLGL